MAEIHVWKIRRGGLRVEMRSTQPNTIRQTSRLILLADQRPLHASVTSGGVYVIELSSAIVDALAAGKPDHDGTFVSLSLVHVLEPFHEGKTWGWTYRVFGNGPTTVEDGAGNQIPRDDDGWVEWGRVDVEFGTRVAILDSIPLDFQFED